MWEEAPFKNMQKSLGDIGVVARGFFGKFEFLFLFSDNKIWIQIVNKTSLTFSFSLKYLKK
jgi:hypothetical protein